MQYAITSFHDNDVVFSQDWFRSQLGTASIKLQICMWTYLYDRVKGSSKSDKWDTLTFTAESIQCHGAFFMELLGQLFKGSAHSLCEGQLFRSFLQLFVAWSDLIFQKKHFLRREQQGIQERVKKLQPAKWVCKLEIMNFFDFIPSMDEKPFKHSNTHHLMVAVEISWNLQVIRINFRSIRQHVCEFHARDWYSSNSSSLSPWGGTFAEFRSCLRSPTALEWSSAFRSMCSTWDPWVMSWEQGASNW